MHQFGRLTCLSGDSSTFDGRACLKAVVSYPTWPK